MDWRLVLRNWLLIAFGALLLAWGLGNELVFPVQHSIGIDEVESSRRVFGVEAAFWLALPALLIAIVGLWRSYDAWATELSPSNRGKDKR